MGFVGRRRERETLESFLDVVRRGGRADAGVAVSLRGRRRVGKSRLVDEFVRASGCPSVWFQGVRGARAEDELAHLATAIADSDLPNARVARDTVPTSLTAALTLLEHAVGTEVPSIVVLDELPWLLETFPGGAGELQRAWDRTLARLPILLILIGSDLTMMERLDAPDQPFHGRARPMLLGPLNPFEVAERTQLDPFDAFDAYLITGGQPQVLEGWTPGMSSVAFLEMSFSSASTPLVTSGTRVLDAEFGGTAGVRQLLTTIGGRGERTRSGILEETQHLGAMSGPTLDGRLAALRDRRILAADEPLSARRAANERRWRIEDPALRFWLAFVQPALDEVDRGRPDLAQLRVDRGFAAWRGRAIEPIVRESIWRMLPETRWTSVRVVGGWWPRSNQPELDLVGADGRPGTVEFVGTVKWRRSPGLTSSEVGQLRDDAVAVPGASPATPLVAVCPAGLADGGLEAVWTADDLLRAWSS